MIYLLLALMVALCALTVGAAVLGRQGQRRLADQMRLVIQSQHATLSQAKTSDTKLDWVRYEQQQSKELQEHHFKEQSKALDHQRKSLEHQRVMLASLSRQMQDLDQIFDAPKMQHQSGGTLLPRSDAANSATAKNKSQAQTSLRPHPAGIRKPVRENQPVSLSQLFRAQQQSVNGNAEEAGTRRSVASEGKSALIKNRDAAALDLRRVANG